MNTPGVALISVKTFSDQNLSMMRSVVRAIDSTDKITKASSIYRVDRAAESLIALRDIQKDERLECYAIVLRIETALQAKDLLEKLQSIEKVHQKEYLRRSVSINLLMLSDEVVMLPELSVPHPEMHLRPEEIVLATEIAGSVRHPVLNENLAELAQKFSKAAWGEFFAQGQTVLDSTTEPN